MNEVTVATRFSDVGEADKPSIFRLSDGLLVECQDPIPVYIPDYYTQAGDDR